MQNFFMSDEIEFKDLGKGIYRRVLSYAAHIMVVELIFEKDAVGPLHSHHHEQCTYILEGVFEFEIDGKKVVLKAGDSTYKQANIVHGVVCLEAGRLLDIFTPAREDFIQ